MPFTLAHPAAVLPLRRFSPRWLSFPALVAGTLSPDTSYIFEPLKSGVAKFAYRFLSPGTSHSIEELMSRVARFAHSFDGSFGYCLPVGLVIFGCGFGLYHLIAKRAPPAIRALLPHPIRFGSLVAIPISVMIGAWSHLLWDGFTHEGEWGVVHLWLLNTHVVYVGRYDLKVHHFLWYFCSFAGVALLCLAYEKWMWGPEKRPALQTWLNPVLAGTLILPIAAIHHVIVPWGNLLAAILTIDVILWLALRISNARTRPPATPAPNRKQPLDENGAFRL